MEVLVIEFSVQNQRMSRYTAGVIASNSYGYLKFKFNFKTDDWNKITVKMANFVYKGHNYPVLIDENNICTVPKEVIHTPSFCVSVFGGGITTNKLTIPVEDSGVVSDEDTSTKYLNEIINQLTAQIDTLSETKADNIILNPEANTIQLLSDGAPIGSCCPLPDNAHSCGIESFIVNENEEIVVTLTTGNVINLGKVDGASGATFTPHIDENKILTWTCDKDLPVPPPTDLNPFDEWQTLPEEGVESDYEWECM